ncbi:sodium ion-translocating decarboxylase subunit beta [Oceanicoccus sp. KOV_DT_Chl]|uniref:sodium ion-translocating decarboxylase subunit beta n=1 Tax=Oceanicoccus sp. KOV_DT_Chl TaxID=1904639 RepID=UPI001F3694FE|nr:sodium ion-translocating decarboxylase subunit beta [Oceanicoccus sp. KOV_DT_Chl]
MSLWYDTGIYQIVPGQFVMVVVGLLLLYLAINRKFEPLLLVPIGFGGILANIPGAGMAFSAVENAINSGDPEVLAEIAKSLGVASWEAGKELYHAYETSAGAAHVAAVQVAGDHGFGNGMLYNFYTVAIASGVAPLVIFMGRRGDDGFWSFAG